MKRFVIALALGAAVVATGPAFETADAAAQPGYRGRSRYGNRGSYRLRHRGYRGYRPWYRSYGYYGYGYPYYRYGYGYGWPWYGLGIGVGVGYSHYGPYYGYGRQQRYRYDDRGAKDYDHYRAGVRVRVSPKEAEVYVDGFYAGTVDDFDGTFQRLYVDPGEREIVLRLEGYQIETRRLHVQSGRTVNLSHTMEPLGAGQSTPPPPEPAGRATADRRSFESNRDLDRDRDRDRYREPGQERDRYRDEERERERPPQRDPDRAGERRTYSSRDARGLESSRDTIPARFGKLVVRVQPTDADIYIDGRLWGSADGFEQLVIHLTAGPHAIEIRSSGQSAFTEEVEIEPGEETPLNVRLDEAR